MFLSIVIEICFIFVWWLRLGWEEVEDSRLEEGVGCVVGAIDRGFCGDILLIFNLWVFYFRLFVIW